MASPDRLHGLAVKPVGLKRLAHPIHAVVGASDVLQLAFKNVEERGVHLTMPSDDPGQHPEASLKAKLSGLARPHDRRRLSRVYAGGTGHGVGSDVADSHEAIRR